MNERRLFCNGFLVGSVSTKVLLEIMGSGFLLSETIKKLTEKKKERKRKNQIKAKQVNVWFGCCRFVRKERRSRGSVQRRKMLII